jgi:hypothetical protein
MLFLVACFTTLSVSTLYRDNGKITDNGSIESDPEGSGRGLMRVLTRYLIRDTEKYHKIPQSE